MVFESLALALPWNWRSGSSTSGSVSERNRLKKRAIRTRAEQVATNGDVSALAGPSNMASYFEGYYPGLVNLSGSFCFLNATLQAMASLSYLMPHIDYVFDKAESLTNIVHTPVVDELRELLANLNTPTSSQLSIRPEEIIAALSRHSHGKHNPLFSSREHQDAQELFQLLSESLKKEIAAVDKESFRDRGLGGMSGGRSSSKIGKSVFDGWTANRRSCRDCGYTEAVMHFAFDNWQLALPRMSTCTLDYLLRDYTRLEELDDCICRRCSMQATYERLRYEADKLTRAAVAADASSSKRRRAREARAMETRVKSALDEGRIEDDIKGLQMEKIFSRASTKQAMIARPPQDLVLHLNRSIHYGGGDAARNNCRVAFNEYLDLTPYTTSGQLSTDPNHPISQPPRLATNYPRYIYRLSAVVCHYGNHYAGHYQQGSYGKSSMRSDPTVIVPILTTLPTVMEMERHEGSGVYSSTSPKSSEETLRPGMGACRSSASAPLNEEDEKNGSGESGTDVSTLNSEKTLSEAESEKAIVADGLDENEAEDKVPLGRMKPRVLMNVSTRQRAKNTSTSPPEPIPSSSSSLADGENHNSDASHIPNGDTPHPTAPSGEHHKVTAPSPSSPKKSKKKPPPAPLEGSTSPLEHGTSLPIPPSPTTPTTATPPAPSSPPRRNKNRLKHHAQQDTAKSPPRPLSPARTVGLRA
ncbi:hypothetical protein EUX98_g2262 [Antrodiella citrinella]|uniref:ubiquitinyl hydrolase 1 n=1 Tax=Antrodiella citrinella TaxID=2447956 RepID=A0A4S4MZD7_9APHY|nr:hypothetical protein EUX98_g2262 [Antrodiella citrinella]